jgi:protein O-GlcNAc transferase
MGVSLLHSAGLPDLVTTDNESYLRAASQLAADKTRLGLLRTSLRATLQKSPLGDAQRAARELESAYRHMWLDWLGQSGSPQAQSAR